VLEDARRLLGLRIQARILERSFNPKFLASIEIFKRAVSTSAKRHERFEELKNSPTFDIDTLTDVFPCWIMRPEDVCRIFPLREGIFDVVIFDEASQCNPDQALPGSTDCGLGGLACLGHAARRMARLPLAYTYTNCEALCIDDASVSRCSSASCLRVWGCFRWPSPQLET